MKMVLGSFAVCFAFGAAAEGPAISDVTVRQRWPWSKLVDIDYVLSGATQSMDIALSAFNGPNPLPLTEASLTGDLSGVSDGARRIVWDPTVTSCTNLGVLGQFRVALTPSPSPLYMVIDLSGGTSATSYPVTNYVAEADVPGGVTNGLYKTTSLLLRRIPANAFLMGDAVPPTLPVTLTKAFYAGVYEVTQKQWQQVMGDVRNWPSKWNNTEYRDTRPVEQVSYYDIRENPANSDDPAVDWPSNSVVTANSFMGRVRAKTGIDGFDLPTEAQWECLCRAGTPTYYSDGIAGTPNGTSNVQMDVLGRYQYNGGKCLSGTSWVDPGSGTTTTGATATVGSYLPNAWGLYDTHGNVWEWCRDWYTNNLGTVAVTDPVGAVSGSYRVRRGGSWVNPASYCRSASRSSDTPSSRNNFFGFRLVRTLP